MKGSNPEAVLADSAPSDAAHDMVHIPGHSVQRVLFQPSDEIASQELYVKLRKGRFVNVSRTSLTIARYSTVTTRTYFGRFPAAYYQRWTAVREIVIRAETTGRGRIRAFASDDNDRERSVGEAEIDSESPSSVEIPVSIDRFLDGGFVWVDIESTAGPLTVSDLRFETLEPAAAKPLSIVICTHNRADDCVSTLQTLTEDPTALAAVDRVFVVDQGTDLVRTRSQFSDIREVLGARLAYIEQGNLGGAGGFTRGIYETMSLPRESTGDIVLMDDDIVLEPESLVRMAAFSARTIDPVIVGAQMLYLYHPNVLHTSAEDANLETLRAGVPVHAKEQGIDLTKKLPFRWAEGGYNAWWTCLVPASVVDQIGYPLPIFFQWDDIEYGLRAREQHIPTVTLPGSAVWHADFALKDRDDWSRYFSYRNSLIVAALRGRWRTSKVTWVLLRDLFEMILSLHYGLAATTILAIDGFLAGPDAVRDGGADVVPEIRAVRENYPDTIRHKPEEMVQTGLFALPAIHSGGYPRIPWLVSVKRTLWQVLGFNRLVGKISSADSNWYHSSQFRRAIVTDAALDSFRIRSFDTRTARKLIRASAGALWRMAVRGAGVAHAWREAQSSLTDRAAWTEIFTTDDAARRATSEGSKANA